MGTIACALALCASLALSQTPTEGLRGPRLDSPELVKLGPGVKAPRLTKEVKPIPPPELKATGANRIVTLECVVLIDGAVGEVRVKKPVESPYDKAAIDAVRQWRFLPATREGKPVPVQVDVEMLFNRPSK